MIKIAWMYPDTLYLHGERGSVMALERTAEAMGLSVCSERIDLGAEGFDPMDYDIIFYGPGEVPSFETVIAEMSLYRDRLREFVESGRVLLVTGASVGMFCRMIILYGDGRAKDGSRRVEGLGLIPADAFEREYVYGNDELIDAVYNGREMELLGNQIQMLDIYLDEGGGCRRLGTVRYGRGNNGDDSSEGAVSGNSIFTNMTGPLLVCDPWLTEEIIKCAAAASGAEVPAYEIDHGLELRSMELKKEFIAEKAAKNIQ